MTPGTLLAGKYRLTRLLGEGAMGVVWAAINEGTDRAVALKLIGYPNEALRRLLVREARACGRLKHRNIVELYDIGETEAGEPFLVMELLSGESLDVRLQRERRLPPTTAVQIALGAARALGVAHAAGIVHRDLKPANIFLHRDTEADEPVVKVFDFGVSKTMTPGGAASHHGGLIGSPLYMSPEQATAGTSVDHRTDLWALGVTLFEMLSGVKPVKGANLYEVIAQLVKGPIPSVTSFASHVDPRLGDVVALCLERDVDKRVSSAAALIALLRPFAPVGERIVDDEERTSLHVSAVREPRAAPIPPPPESARPADDEATVLYQRPPTLTASTTAPLQTPGEERRLPSLAEAAEAPEEKPAGSKRRALWIAMAAASLLVVAGALTISLGGGAPPGSPAVAPGSAGERRSSAPDSPIAPPTMPTTMPTPVSAPVSTPVSAPPIDPPLEPTSEPSPPASVAARPAPVQAAPARITPAATPRPTATPGAAASTKKKDDAKGLIRETPF